MAVVCTALYVRQCDNWPGGFEAYMVVPPIQVQPAPGVARAPLLGRNVHFWGGAGLATQGV